MAYCHKYHQELCSEEWERLFEKLIKEKYRAGEIKINSGEGLIHINRAVRLFSAAVYADIGNIVFREPLLSIKDNIGQARYEIGWQVLSLLMENPLNPLNWPRFMEGSIAKCVIDSIGFKKSEVKAVHELMKKT